MDSRSLTLEGQDMTDDTQPEAMDLADWLEAVGGGGLSPNRCARFRMGSVESPRIPLASTSRTKRRH
jgi:hypothetical protein